MLKALPIVLAISAGLTLAAPNIARDECQVTPDSLCNPPNPTPTTLPQQLEVCIYLTNDYSWNGESENLCNLSGYCSAQVPDGLNANVSSAGPSQGETCYLYSDINCFGEASPAIYYPGFGDLREINFDKKLRSWRCWNPDPLTMSFPPPTSWSNSSTSSSAATTSVVVPTTLHEYAASVTPSAVVISAAVHRTRSHRTRSHSTTEKCVPPSCIGPGATPSTAAEHALVRSPTTASATLPAHPLAPANKDVNDDCTTTYTYTSYDTAASTWFSTLMTMWYQCPPPTSMIETSSTSLTETSTTSLPSSSLSSYSTSTTSFSETSTESSSVRTSSYSTTTTSFYSSSTTTLVV